MRTAQEAGAFPLTLPPARHWPGLSRSMPKKAKLKHVGNVNKRVRAFNQKVGRRIHKLARERGATTITLAEAVGVSQAQISRLQNGQQGFRSAMLFKMAAALGVEVKDLLPR